MADRAHAHPLDHARTLASAPGNYANFVDELFRLKLVDAEQRNILKQGLRRAAGKGDLAERPIVPPASSHIESGRGLAERALKAGLVREVSRNRFRLKAGPETVHWGYLWGAAEPALRVEPGATVIVETVSHEGLLGDQGPPEKFFARHGIARSKVLADAAQIYAKVQHSGLGPHVVSAPVYVEGAEPGDVLVVRILDVTPRVPYGVNSMRTNKGGLPDEFTLNRSIVIPFDLERRVAKFSDKIEVPLAPFFGIMAVGPARSLGRMSSVPPGTYGGNIDLKDLVAGTTFYLPVHVPGALFMVGDGHAAQGDGEVDLTAIETSMTGTFQLDLVKGRPLAWPRAETRRHWIVFGLDEDLNEAMKMCIRETVKFLGEEKGLKPADAYALASIAVDFEVTQVVDQVKGIHAMIPKRIFK